MLDFCDEEIVESLRTICATSVSSSASARASSRVERHGSETITHLASGKRIAAEAVFYSAGRQGATDELELDKAGLDGRRARPDPGRRRLPHVRRRTSSRPAT